MEHFSHPHLLLLNEDYDARDGDVCYGCQEQIVPCKSFVYSCIRRSISGSTSTHSECLKFFLHKSCAELPKTIVNPLHETNPWYHKEFLALYSRPSDMPFVSAPPVCWCKICGAEWKWFTYNDGFNVNVCLKCAMYQVQSLEHRKIYHPAHTQHRLTLVQRLSAFKCDVCKLEDNRKDLSYICTKCPFWMHKSCADAPTSFQFQFHNKHPLKLSYSLPQVYHKFPQHCRLCNKTLPGEIIVGQTLWLYYCAKCRFFVHFQCARSRRMLSSAENEVYPNLVHLPAADESSVNLLFEEFVKAITSLNNNSSVLRGTNCIKHWAHNAHYLQLITTNELTDWTDYNDDILLLCDGCVKPIPTNGDLFYCCIPCKYFLHKTCAELPKKIEHHLWPGKTIFAAKYKKPYTCFYCEGCGVYCNGIFFHYRRGPLLHIGCAVLPKMIKHEAHHHQLKQVYVNRRDVCKACGLQYYVDYKHGCEECDYYICGRCIMNARTVKHRWDPHPLHLMYEAGMVEDHEHEFNCEFCSEDIDTNFWFYHCSDCDLSLHLYCFERSFNGHYSTIKFGATNIIIDKLHPHSLIFVLEKKSRFCKICEDEQLGEPVLECAAGCKTIFCRRCYESVRYALNDHWKLL